ncbi:MAG: FAD-dependent oxidoreductase [Candidatus Nealsonbacteria bacterium]|nr:MAG: FAD-dependent oxidoreductase [Candidatus Nealsonbacteria bacterium]
MPYELIIIGGGPAGITAGIYAARQKINTLLITKDFGGQIAKKAVAIENYPGFEAISGIELVEKFKKQLSKYKIDIERDEVIKVKKVNKSFFISTRSKKEFEAKAVIVASGADPRPLEVPGEKEFIGKGVSYCAVCLPSGEEIVANNSLEKIEEIGISHQVLTGDRNFKNISQIIGRDYRGKIIKVKIRFFTEPVRLTSNHPVLTSKVKRIPHRKVQVIDKPKWKKAEELNSQDVVLYPIISKIKDIEKIRFSKILGVEVKNGKAKNDQETYTSHRISDVIPVDEKFLRLGGYYLAEGSLGRQEVMIYFNKKEKKYINDSVNLIKKLFSLNPYVKTAGGVVRISIFSKLVRDLFQTLFGKNAPNKKIPHWMLFLPLEKQKEIIKGFYRGDGCLRNKDFCIVTTSRTLAYQMRDILLRFKIIPGIERRKKEKLNKVPGEIGGRKIRFNYDKYHIRIGGPSLKKMSEILSVYHPYMDKRNRVCRHAWIKGNYLYLPIREVESEGYRGRVYNLRVEGNNTYIAKNFIVHNCDGAVFSGKTVAVIGGGNSAFETALFLTNLAKKIYILEYGSEIKADKENQEAVEKSGKVKIITNAALKEIKGDKFVNSLVYQDRKTKEEKTLDVEGIFVEIGYQPTTFFVKGLVDFNEEDEIKIEFETCQTKTPGLFAAGDVNVGKFKQVTTACGEGTKAALAAFNYLKGLKV